MGLCFCFLVYLKYRYFTLAGKFETALEDIEAVLEGFGIYPKSIETGRDLGNRDLGKGYDKTLKGGKRNKYGDGWNEGTMKIKAAIFEILDKI